MFLIPIRKHKPFSALLLCVILYLISLSLIKIDDDSTLRLKNLQDHVQDSQSFFTAFKKLTYGLDEKSIIDEEVDNQFEIKINNDKEDKFWTLDTDLTNTRVNIPYYYLDKSNEIANSTILQPFDPRFTLGIYANYIKESLLANPKKEVIIPFHWYDWVDLSLLNQYLVMPDGHKYDCKFFDVLKGEKESNDKNSPRAVESFCYDDDSVPREVTDQKNYMKTGFGIYQSPRKTTIPNMKLAGKSYLYSYAPAPQAIIFLSEKGSYTVRPGKKQRLLDSSLVSNFIAKTKSKVVDSLKEFTSLIKAVRPNSSERLNAYSIDIPKESFMVNYKPIVKEYEEKMRKGGKISRSERNYYSALKYSEQAVKNGGPPKYFSEAKLVKGQPGAIYGDHYDWRFFNGITIGTEEQSLVLHRLIRTWLSFTQNHGITTWIAHGSLLSWYWNGAAFPWDEDIDVQVPIADLHKLSKFYNQTLIIEDLEEGYGRYFLDCGSFITLRERSNGNNNIDARLIDVDTGLYIDITGLAISDTNPPGRYEDMLPEKFQGNGLAKNLFLEAYNCRNNHFSLYKELSPLVATFVEGQAAYVPKSFAKILQVEYSKGLENDRFRDFTYVPQLRMWIHKMYLDKYIGNATQWELDHSYLEFDDAEKIDLKKRGLSDEYYGKVMTFNETDIISILSNDDLYIAYYNSRDFTELHQKEMLLLESHNSTEKLLKNKEFAPLRKDHFSYKVRQDFLNYDREVSKYAKLAEGIKEEYAKLTPTTSSTIAESSPTPDLASDSQSEDKYDTDGDYQAAAEDNSDLSEDKSIEDKSIEEKVDEKKEDEKKEDEKKEDEKKEDEKKEDEKKEDEKKEDDKIEDEKKDN